MADLALDPRPDLTPVTELVTEVQPIVDTAHAVFAKPCLSVELIDVGSLRAGMRRKEETRRVRQRQVHLTGDQGSIAHLQIPHPFAARLRDLRQDKARRRVISRVALEVILEAQPETDVVGPP